jgi:hypothetical protein
MAGQAEAVERLKALRATMPRVPLDELMTMRHEGTGTDADGQADSDTTLQLARAHRLTIYDAAYRELAVRRHLALVTFDAALAAAARSEKR